MLEIKELFVKAGNFSLKDVSINVRDKECHVIIGPTGGGKTTLIETIVGFRKPTKGDILINGRSIKGLSSEERGFSYVPQDLALFPHLSVKDNVLYGLKIRGIKDTKYRILADEIIDVVGIRHLMKRSVKNLSGGERQRVALVRAIVPGYKYLILDEPLSALHEGLKRELWFLTKELQQRLGLTILMVTHDLEEAFFLGDSVSIMIDGRIRQTGDRSSIFRRPADLDVTRFFGIRNLFEVEVVNIQGETLETFSPDINAELKVLRDAVPPGIKKGDRLFAGIRVEDVMVLREGLLRPNQDNLLKGLLKEIFQKGASHLVFFWPENSKRYIEIEIPDYAFKKLSLQKGQKMLVSLKKENIFILKPA